MTLSRFMEAERAINERLDSQTQEMQVLRAMMLEFMAEQTKLHEEERRHFARQVTVELEHKEMLQAYQGFKATVHVLSLIEKFSVTVVKIAAAIGITYGVWRFAILDTIERYGAK